MDKADRKDNYLDFIPSHDDKIRWDKNDKEEITLYIENKGIFNRLTQMLFKKPKVTQIHLEGMGNYIWPLLDGSRSIYDVGMLVKEKFGEEAEPLFPRLIQYIKMLEGYGFIKVLKN